MTENERNEDIVIKDLTDWFCIQLSRFGRVLEYLVDIFLVFLQVVAEALHDTCEMRCACLLKINFIYIELFNSFFLPNCWFIEQIVLFIIFTLDLRVLLSSLLTQNGEGVNHPSSYAKDAYYDQVHHHDFRRHQEYHSIERLAVDYSVDCATGLYAAHNAEAALSRGGGGGWLVGVLISAI